MSEDTSVLLQITGQCVGCADETGKYFGRCVHCARNPSTKDLYHIQAEAN